MQPTAQEIATAVADEMDRRRVWRELREARAERQRLARRAQGEMAAQRMADEMLAPLWQGTRH